MYEAFYGFKEKPFSMLPDPDFLYLSKKHQAALTLLEYGLVNHVGFCVISGEAGAGKTTILRALLKRVGDEVTVGMITNTHQSFGGLLDWVLSAFDLHRPNLTHVEMHQVFLDYLIEQYADNRTVLLIVDEAQNMKAEALEELRMLSNVNSDKDQLMQVVLAGQPSLKEKLRLPELKQFAQRIAVDYHLDSLGLKETCGYIQHRLITAGATKDVFTPAACERIHCYSGGTPRLINLLCETVLVYGFADQQEVIDVDLVDEMVQERMKDSVVPIVNRDIVFEESKEVDEELERDFPWIQPEGGTEGLKPASDVSTGEEKRIIESFTSPESTTVKNVGDDEIVAPVDEQAAIETSLSLDTAPEDLPDLLKSVEDEAKYDEKENKAAAAKGGLAKSDKNTDSLIDSANSLNSSDSDNSETVGQVKKFGILGGVLAIVLVLLAVVLDDDANLEEIKNEALEMQKQREQEELKLKQLQLEAQALKMERDEAIAKAEQERRASQKAELLAIEKAAAAAKVAEENLRLEEEKRVAAAKERERKAMQAEAEAKAEALYAKREAARLAEERLVMQRRLDEEIRLKKLEEARRLELERIELERKQLESAVSSEPVDQTPEKESKKVSEECSGPTARFKSGCR